MSPLMPGQSPNIIGNRNNVMQGNNNTSTSYDVSSCCSSSRRRNEFACLYTKHKTQKRKVWSDGRLVMQGTRLLLHSADPQPGSADLPLDECEITTTQQQSFLLLLQQQQQSGHSNHVESEKFLIQLEGPWQRSTTTTTTTTTNNNLRRASATTKSAGMKKLLHRKFQKPKPFIPPARNPNHRLEQVLGKRRRPLQPGELERTHYGRGGGGGGGGTFDPHQQQPQPAGEAWSGGNPHNNTGMPPHMDSASQPSNTTTPPPGQGSRIVNPYQRQYQQHQQQQQQYIVQANGISNHVHHQGIPVPNQDPFRSNLLPNNPTTSTNTNNRTKTPVVAAPASSTSSGDGFVSNEFNASSFYGVEEEEEEQDQGDQHQPTNNNWYPPQHQVYKQQHQQPVDNQMAQYASSENAPRQPSPPNRDDTPDAFHVSSSRNDHYNGSAVGATTLDDDAPNAFRLQGDDAPDAFQIASTTNHGSTLDDDVPSTFRLEASNPPWGREENKQPVPQTSNSQPTWLQQEQTMDEQWTLQINSNPAASGITKQQDNFSNTDRSKETLPLPSSNVTKVTGSQLLELFGAVPDPDTDQEDETSTAPPEPGIKTTEMEASSNNNKENSAAVGAFYLPPPSQSSTSESSSSGDED